MRQWCPPGWTQQKHPSQRSNVILTRTPLHSFTFHLDLSHAVLNDVPYYEVMLAVTTVRLYRSYCSIGIFRNAASITSSLPPKSLKHLVASERCDSVVDIFGRRSHGGIEAVTVRTVPRNINLKRIEGELETQVGLTCTVSRPRSLIATLVLLVRPASICHVIRLLSAASFDTLGRKRSPFDE